MDVEDGRGLVPGKLVDVALVSATAVLVLASVGVGMVTQFVDSLVAGLAGAVGLQGSVATAVVSKLLPLLVWTGTLLLIFRVVPAKRPRFPDAIAGAVVTAAMLDGLGFGARAGERTSQLLIRPAHEPLIGGSKSPTGRRQHGPTF